MKKKEPRSKLRIVHIEEEPIEQFSYRCASSGGGGITAGMLPVYHGSIEGLPQELEALIVASDLQGTTVQGKEELLIGEALPEYLLLLLEMEFPRIDAGKIAVLLCGDLYADPAIRGSSGSPAPVWQAFRRSFPAVAGIAGNHDLLSISEQQQLQTSAGIYFAGRPEVMNVAQLEVAALGGVIGRADKPGRMPEPAYIETIGKLLNRRPDCLLLHESPDFPALQFSGKPCIREVLEAGAETVVFCGHVHWDTPFVQLKNGTQVVNADSRVFIFTGIPK